VSAARFICLPVVHEALRLAAPRAASERCFTLTARDASFPLHCRVGTSDVEVFRQIFVEREYASIADLNKPRTLIDCGANVGFASAWFLSRYPTLQSIAVEPDSANAVLLRKNLAPFGARATVHERGIWSRTTGLNLVRGEFRDGREWAIQVRESQPNETPDLLAIDLASLIDEAGVVCVDILKVDIEGAEGEVFKGPIQDWLDRVRNLVIEVHSDELAKVVDAALPEAEFARSFAGELTYYRRRQLQRENDNSARDASFGAGAPFPRQAP
jgi:FkbM family methyltransferase